MVFANEFQCRFIKYSFKCEIGLTESVLIPQTAESENYLNRSLKRVK